MTPDSPVPVSADAATSPDLTRCRCVWRGERCDNQATEEDGLCNWCAGGGSRPISRLLRDPKAVIGPNGELWGIGGAGQTHDFDPARPASTAACWYPESDRILLDWPS